MALIDRRFRLYFWAAPVRATVALVAGVVFLLVWDVAGIASGIFLHTPNAISTGLMLAPHLPVEEIVFLAFLCYLAMVAYTGALRLRSARGRGAGARAAPGRAARGRTARRTEAAR
ncbi:lycopene cyclase domain-containing protein [Agromyces sp. CFH 90414]|uniref:Lycopene cyclase domain-containing protein n=2 Tax=Agromyces agglutinans TaxID=2662258 RepID=A0A6I2F5A9_9MICO|nr:lycopene cyclase domain-containing protein [Agromyces agglutinans]